MTSSSASSVQRVEVDVPEAFEPLLKPARYKGAFGGRGGAKSWFFANQIVLKAFTSTVRIVCIREVQHTLRESARDLIASRIQALGLGPFFEILEDRIRSKNGSLIIFRGMQSYNAENIKSLEDFDLAWVEEAQTLSERSLRYLRPTIRKPGSELWFSWNPRHDTDPVDRFFRGSEARTNATLVQVGWSDNPWFTKELADDKARDYTDDPEMAEHVWGGGYEIISQGAYFARRLADAEREGRVGFYPHFPALPVYTAWDIGVDDYTAIWFFQIRQIDDTMPSWRHATTTPRVRVIDYYEASGAGADEIIAAALPEYSKDLQTRAEALVELGRDEPFQYGRHFWPHDVKVREWGSGAKTRVEIVTSLGIPIASMALGAAQNPEERIAATRALIPLCEFHQSRRVVHGISRLRRYSRKLNEALGVYMGPLHDENSHAADAFGEFAANAGVRALPRPPERLEELPPGSVRAPPVPVRDPSRIVL